MVHTTVTDFSWLVSPFRACTTDTLVDESRPVVGSVWVCVHMAFEVRL